MPTFMGYWPQSRLWINRNPPARRSVRLQGAYGISIASSCSGTPAVNPAAAGSARQPYILRLSEQLTVLFHDLAARSPYATLWRGNVSCIHPEPSTIEELERHHNSRHHECYSRGVFRPLSGGPVSRFMILRKYAGIIKHQGIRHPCVSHWRLSSHLSKI